MDVILDLKGRILPQCLYIYQIITLYTLSYSFISWIDLSKARGRIKIKQFKGRQNKTKYRLRHLGSNPDHDLTSCEFLGGELKLSQLFHLYQLRNSNKGVEDLQK